MFYYVDYFGFHFFLQDLKNLLGLFIGFKVQLLYLFQLAEGIKWRRVNTVFFQREFEFIKIFDAMATLSDYSSLPLAILFNCFLVLWY